MVKEFFDQISKNLASELPKTSIAKLMINLEDVRIAQGYVTAKVENRYSDMVNINIQPGKPGIALHETLVNLKGMTPSVVYILTASKDKKTIIRKLPFNGFSDWLLIFEDTLFLEAVNDGCDEIELFIV
ncbi:MAG: hypothetical protein ACRD38_09790 [Nitrososphaerales archaeon]